MSEHNDKKHIYDDIEELDNDLPNWWLYTFCVSIVFAVIYMVYYHVTETGLSQVAIYEMEQEQLALEKLKQPADDKSPFTEEEFQTELTKPERIAQGKGIYMGKCLACHGGSAEGGIGPNLTDEYWIHGGKPHQVAQVISNGVPEKGMIAWNSIVSRDEIKSLVVFIRSVKDTHPPGAKAPQGEKEL